MARTPRVTEEPKATVGTTVVSFERIRFYAEHEFIADPNGRTVDDHYKLLPPEFGKKVSIHTFRTWAYKSTPTWADARKKFWEDVEVRVVAGLRERFIKERIEEHGALRENLGYLWEWLMPLRDPITDEVLRHGPIDDEGKPNPYVGLPKFPLAMPPLDRMAKVILDVQARVMLTRGEVLNRTEGAEGATSPSAPESPGFSLTKDEARYLATQLVKGRYSEQLSQSIDLEAVSKDPEEEPDESI